MTERQPRLHVYRTVIEENPTVHEQLSQGLTEAGNFKPHLIQTVLRPAEELNADVIIHAEITRFAKALDRTVDLTLLERMKDIIVDRMPASAHEPLWVPSQPVIPGRDPSKSTRRYVMIGNLAALQKDRALGKGAVGAAFNRERAPSRAWVADEHMQGIVIMRGVSEKEKLAMKQARKILKKNRVLPPELELGPLRVEIET